MRIGGNLWTQMLSHMEHECNDEFYDIIQLVAEIYLITLKREIRRSILPREIKYLHVIKDDNFVRDITHPPIISFPRLISLC
jgi:hypothetical protein